MPRCLRHARGGYVYHALTARRPSHAVLALEKIPDPFSFLEKIPDPFSFPTPFLFSDLNLQDGEPEYALDCFFADRA
jgi:hypothetical protein